MLMEAQRPLDHAASLSVSAAEQRAHQVAVAARPARPAGQLFAAMTPSAGAPIAVRRVGYSPGETVAQASSGLECARVPRA